MFPVLNSSDGSLSYDTSRYRSLQSVGYRINHYCVQALGMPGLPPGAGSGGIDIAGKLPALGA